MELRRPGGLHSTLQEEVNLGLCETVNKKGEERTQR